MTSAFREQPMPLAVASSSLSVLQLSTTLGAAIVDVVERMHGTISLARSAWHRRIGRHPGVARSVY